MFRSLNLLLAKKLTSLQSIKWAAMGCVLAYNACNYYYIVGTEPMRAKVHSADEVKICILERSTMTDVQFHLLSRGSSPPNVLACQFPHAHFSPLGTLKRFRLRDTPPQRMNIRIYAAAGRPGDL